MAKTWSAAAPATGAKITAALLTEIITAIDTLWHRRGTASTGGTGGTTVTLTPAESSANYDVTITFSEDPGGDCGHIWIDSKAAGNFVVKNQGVSGKNFTWQLHRIPS